MKYSKYSAVIIGSGISGLYLASRLSKSNNLKEGILLVTKSRLSECNSRLAQGGIVAVMPDINKEDSISSHIKDTIKAGAGLNDFNAVKYVSECSSLAVKSLIDMGVNFDKKKDGSLDFTLEAAHSLPRILHTKDKTGESIENVLIEKVKEAKEIETYEDTMAVEILTDKENIVRGVLLYNELSGEYEAVLTNALVIATGGAGQLYKHTTSLETNTGDGLYLANSIGAELLDMEFIQFHPTALASKNKATMPLVSEAVRGEGAKLVNSKGERFILKYSNMGELAPRDIVARGIYNELKESGEDCVFLDISDIGIEKFKTSFPKITAYCLEEGIDLNKGLIPVSPATHYFMGGIKVNLDFETNIKNLYAIGEASRTGFHGANRLASNSLLECIVGALALYENLSYKDLSAPKNYDEKIKNVISKYEKEEKGYIENAPSLKNEIKEIMWKYAGILRSEKYLNEGLYELSEIKRQIQGKKVFSDFASYEVRNMLDIAEIILNKAKERKNSIGAHFREDAISDIGDIEIIEDLKKNEFSVK